MSTHDIPPVDDDPVLREALKLDPDYGDARINLALVHRGRGDDDSARRELEGATRDPRARATAFLQLGALELSAGRVTAAREALESGTKAAPTRVDGWNLLGEAYRREGRLADAERAWRRSLELAPNQSQIIKNVENMK